jgi:hypothetical protein
LHHANVPFVDDPSPTVPRLLLNKSMGADDKLNLMPAIRLNVAFLSLAACDRSEAPIDA